MERVGPRPVRDVAIMRVLHIIMIVNLSHLFWIVLMAMYLLFLDFEATGLSRYNDQIVQIGMCIAKWGGSDTVPEKLTPSFQCYVKPSIATMSEKARQITGITMEQLATAESLDCVLGRWLTYIESVCVDPTYPRILLTYNGFGFDIPLLVSELERQKPQSAVQFIRRMRLEYMIDLLPVVRTHGDTTKLKRRANGVCSYTLSDVYAALVGQPLVGAHDALVDCLALIDLVPLLPIRTILMDTGSSPARKNPVHYVKELLLSVIQQHILPGSTKRKSQTVSSMLNKRPKVELKKI